jgi:hypothetical protein
MMPATEALEASILSWCLVASSEIFRSPRIASSATLALNSAVNRVRVPAWVDNPVALRQQRPNQRSLLVRQSNAFTQGFLQKKALNQSAKVRSFQPSYRSVLISTPMHNGLGLDRDLSERLQTKRLFYARHQRDRLERLAQETEGAGGFDLPAQPLLGKGGDEDHRDGTAACPQRTLQIDAAHAWHLHIRDEAVRPLDHGRGEEGLRRGEGLCVQPVGEDEVLRRDPDFQVVVDNRDRRHFPYFLVLARAICIGAAC